MRRSRFGSTVVFALGLAVACGGGGGGPVGPGGDDGSGTLGVAGGTVRLQTQAGVTVPAGALTGDVTITAWIFPRTNGLGVHAIVTEEGAVDVAGGALVRHGDRQAEGST